MVFHAPWGKKLSFTTLLVILGLCAISVVGRVEPHRAGIVGSFMISAFPLLLAGGSSFFVIRGYIVTKETLFVQRLFWNSRIDLEDLQSYEIDPQAMSGSIRTMGNGGMFCIAGYFHNKKLGSFRAFASDPKLSVVLRFPGKTIVVTPDNPAQFVAALKDITA